MVRLAVVILIFVLASKAIAWVQRERQIRRHRRLHWALFDPDRDSPKLSRWVDNIVQAFPGIAALRRSKDPNHRLPNPQMQPTNADWPEFLG
jgi:hypothetical protein